MDSPTGISVLVDRDYIGHVFSWTFWDICFHSLFNLLSQLIQLLVVAWSLYCSHASSICLHVERLVRKKTSLIVYFLLFRLRLASFDNRGKLMCSRSTGYQLLTLEKDQVREWCQPGQYMCHCCCCQYTVYKILLQTCLIFVFSLQSPRSIWWWT